MIKRWNPTNEGPYCFESKAGNYVDYSDYAALESKCREQAYALRAISQWDMLNPVRTDLIGDLGWLKTLVAPFALETPTIAQQLKAKGYPRRRPKLPNDDSPEETIVKCPECCCSYVAGADHASVCPDRHKETKVNDAIATSFKPHSVANRSVKP